MYPPSSAISFVGSCTPATSAAAGPQTTLLLDSYIGCVRVYVDAIRLGLCTLGGRSKERLYSSLVRHDENSKLAETAQIRIEKTV